MKVNKVLAFIKLHYFFIFAGVSPLIPFLPVYANVNLGISYIGIGFIYTVLPILGFLSKALSGMVADWFNAHRTVFLTSILFTALGFLSIYFVTPMPTIPNPTPAKLKFDCSHPASYLRYKIPEDKCGVTDFIDVIKDDNFTVAICEVDCPASPATIKDICNLWNITPSECEHVLKFTAYTYLVHAQKQGMSTFFPIHNISYFEVESFTPTCKKHVLLNCTAVCNNNALMDFFGAPLEIPITDSKDIISHYQFWLFLICMAIGWCGLAIVTVMSDTICFQLIGQEGSNYGKERMFGSLGWGLSAMFAGFLIDIYSDDSHTKDYTPAFILSISMMFFDFISATKLKIIPQEKRSDRASSVIRLFSEPRIVLFLLCVINVGIATNLLWTFQMILVETVAYDWDCDFPHMKLLQGLIMAVQCFGGEIPFFFLSEKFIKRLGHYFCMSLVIAVFGIRYILYYFVINPWMFLLIDLLNGFTFGIFYATMTSYASIIAPPSTQATIQGIFGASFEGLGMAIGAFVGGALFSLAGEAETFLYAGIFNLCFALVYTAIHMALSRFQSPYQLANTSAQEGPLQGSDSASPMAQEELHEQ